MLDAKGPVRRGETIDFDVTAAVTGDGTYCFVLDSTADDEVTYRATEADGGGPTVQIAVDGGCEASE